MPTQTYNTIGPHTFTVPAGVLSVSIYAIGGGAGGSSGSGSVGGTGGAGGSCSWEANISVSPLQELSVYVADSAGPDTAGYDSMVLDSGPTVLVLAPGGNSSTTPIGGNLLSGGSGGIGDSGAGGGGGGAGGEYSAGSDGESAASSVPGLGGAGGSGTIALGGAGGMGAASGDDPYSGELPGGGGGGGNPSGSGASGSGGRVQIVWTTPTPPAAPTGLAKTSSSSMSWDAVAAADSYSIYKNGTLVTSGVTTETYTFSPSPSNGDIIEVRSVENLLESSSAYLLWSDGTVQVELSSLPTHCWEMDGNYLPSFGTIPLAYNSGTVAWTTGKLGQCLNTGTIKSASNIVLPNSGWSVSVWGQARSTSNGTGNVIYRTGDALFGVDCTDSPRGLYSLNMALQPSTDQAYNWAHYLLTYDGAAAKLFVNGVLADTEVKSDAWAFNAAMIFGGKACIDQVAIWTDTVLTADDAAALYAGGDGSPSWQWKLPEEESTNSGTTLSSLRLGISF